jgi:hypothetical protein
MKDVHPEEWFRPAGRFLHSTPVKILSPGMRPRAPSCQGETKQPIKSKLPFNRCTHRTRHLFKKVGVRIFDYKETV